MGCGGCCGGLTIHLDFCVEDRGVGFPGLEATDFSVFSICGNGFGFAVLGLGLRTIVDLLLGVTVFVVPWVLAKTFDLFTCFELYFL